jgi:hypothetical protein
MQEEIDVSLLSFPAKSLPANLNSKELFCILPLIDGDLN